MKRQILTINSLSIKGMYISLPAEAGRGPDVHLKKMIEFGVDKKLIRIVEVQECDPSTSSG